MPKKSGPSIGALFILNRLSVIGFRDKVGAFSQVCKISTIF